MASSSLTAPSTMWHFPPERNSLKKQTVWAELKQALRFQLGSLINNRGRSLFWSWGWLRRPLVWQVIISQTFLVCAFLCTCMYMGPHRILSIVYCMCVLGDRHKLLSKKSRVNKFDKCNKYIVENRNTVKAKISVLVNNCITGMLICIRHFACLFGNCRIYLNILV